MGRHLSDPPTSGIAGVRLRKLRVIPDARGAVMHMLRADMPEFDGFGEIYFSLVYPGMVKAWKRHLNTIQHFAVPMGRIRLILYDGCERRSENNILESYEIGRPDAYYLVRIPPMVWYGFQGLGAEDALVANCINIPYDPKECEVMPHDSQCFPQVW